MSFAVIKHTDRTRRCGGQQAIPTESNLVAALDQHPVSIKFDACVAVVLLCCLQVKQAVEAGTLTESDLDGALANTLRMRFITGQFDPPAANPWASLPISTVNSREHRQLARQVVHKGESRSVGVWKKGVTYIACGEALPTSCL